MNLRSLNLVLFLSFLIHTNLYAQEFSSIEFGVSYLHFELLDNSYESRWTVDNAITISGRTPFYLGQLGLQYTKFEFTPKSDLPTYSAFTITAGLYLPIKIKDNINLVTGLFTGIERTRAKELEGFLGSKESELLLGFEFEPTVQFKNLSFYLDSEYQKTFYRLRKSTISIGLGIRYNFQIPQKMVEFIR